MNKIYPITGSFNSASSTSYKGSLIPSQDQVKNRGAAGTLTGQQEALAGQFKILQRNQPTVRLRLNSPYNALAFQDSLDKIDRNRRPNPVSEQTRVGERFVKEQQTKYTQLKGELNTLHKQTSLFADLGGLNTRTAKVRDKNLLLANVASNATTGSYNVTVESLAKKHKVGGSDAFDPSAALGLTGSIKINGFSVSIEAADSLASIAEKINIGEDRNYNNRLDPAEDLNNNGAIDTWQRRGSYAGTDYTKPVYVAEDLNDNGTLDPAEDTNNNDYLDKGGAEIGVKAAIFDNRLVFVSQQPADILISLEDPDQVLQSLGILVRNPQTGRAEPDKSNPQYQEASPAAIAVNGVRQESPDNAFTGLPAGLSFEVKRTGSTKVAVEQNLDQAAKPVIDLAASYNSAINFLNIVIGGQGGLSRNLRLQSIYSETVRNFLSAPGRQFGSFSSVQDVGLNINKKEPTAIAQTAFEQLSQKNGLPLPGKGSHSLSSQLEKVGVNSNDNFTLTVDEKKLKSKIEQDATGVRDLLAFTAARTGEAVGRFTQDEYGTIALQQESLNTYLTNPDVADKSVKAGVDQFNREKGNLQLLNIFA